MRGFRVAKSPGLKPVDLSLKFSPSDKPAAVVAAAFTGECAFVVRLAVIAGDLLAGLDLPARIKLDMLAVDAHVRVGRAGMVDIPEPVGRLRGVDGAAVVQLDDGDLLTAAGAGARFPPGDELAGEFTDLHSGRDELGAEQAPPVDAAVSKMEQDARPVTGEAGMGAHEWIVMILNPNCAKTTNGANGFDLSALYSFVVSSSA